MKPTAGPAMMPGVKRGDDEYREIVRRANRVRERAAESLRPSFPSRKRRRYVGSSPDATPRARRRAERRAP